LPSMAFPVYFSASFVEVFKELIGEDVQIRLLFTNVDWKVVQEGKFQAHGEPVFGSAKTLELEHPMTGIGFILGAIASDLFNQGAYLRAEKIFNLTQSHTLGDEHLLYAEFAQLTRAYDHWDKFEFKEALGILQSVQERKNITGFSLIRTLKPLVEKNITALVKLQKEDKIEQIVDIFENAERRMVQAKYDDAVARYYRCLDMIAQYALSKYGVNTTDVNLSSLPKETLECYQKARGGALPEHYQAGVGGIALRDAFLLLACLADPLGKAFEEQTPKFLGFITARNYSILGHGTKPITKERAESIRDGMVIPFLEKLSQQEHFDSQGVRENHRFPQLPTNIKSLFSGTNT
jgi:CRISPR-associated protein (TIGR02710 family)